MKIGLNKLGSVKNTALKYGIKYSPHAYSYGKSLLKNSQKIYTPFKFLASRIYQNKIKQTPFGRKIDKGFNFINSYA